MQLKEIVKKTEVFDILNEAAVNLHNQHAHNMLGLFLSTAVSQGERLRTFNLHEMQMVINAVIDAGQVVTRGGPKPKYSTTKDFWLTFYNEQYCRRCLHLDILNVGANSVEYVAKMNKSNLLKKN